MAQSLAKLFLFLKIVCMCVCVFVFVRKVLGGLVCLSFEVGLFAGRKAKQQQQVEDERARGKKCFQCSTAGWKPIFVLPVWSVFNFALSQAKMDNGHRKPAGRPGTLAAAAASFEASSEELREV